MATNPENPLSSLPQPACLPGWPETMRGAPNAIVRSALFRVANHKQPRAWLKNAPITTLSGMSITYTGQELRQDDADCFLQLVHLSRGKPLGDWAEFTAYGMLKTLGWSLNSVSQARLKDCITRLTATAIVISGNQGGYGGSIVHEFAWVDKDGFTPSRIWRVRLNPRIAAIFDGALHTRVEWERRMELGPMAKWLHLFYGSHQAPLPFKVGTLKELMRSDAKTLFHYRNDLKRALEQLREAGFISKWSVDANTDLVRVGRSKAGSN